MWKEGFLKRKVLEEGFHEAEGRFPKVLAKVSEGFEWRSLHDASGFEQVLEIRRSSDRPIER